MPLLSQPWASPASASSALEASADGLSNGVAESAARAVSFLGPLALGALVWEIAIDIGSDAQACKRFLRYYNFPDYTVRRVTLHAGASHVISFLARLVALASISVYLAYTHGATELECNAWPRAVVALMDLAICLSTAVVLLRLLSLAPMELYSRRGWPTALAWLLQLCAVMPSILAWKGGSLASGRACYLEINRWSAVGYVVPLVLLLVAPPLLIWAAHTSVRPTSMSTMTSAGQGIFDSMPSRRGSRIGSPQMRDLNIAELPTRWQAAVLSGQSLAGGDRVGRLAVPNDGRSLAAEEAMLGRLQDANREKSFLKLNEREDERTEELPHEMYHLVHGCLAWWAVAVLTLLAGVIIDFWAVSPILSFAFTPIATVLLPLCASRMAQTFPQRRARRPSYSRKVTPTPVAGSTVGRNSTAFLEAARSAIDAPASVQSRTRSLPRQSISPPPGSRAPSRTGTTSSKSHSTHNGSKIGGKLMHHLSGRSLRAQLKRDLAGSTSTSPGLFAPSQTSESAASSPPETYTATRRMRTGKRVSPTARSSKTRSDASSGNPESLVDPAITQSPPPPIPGSPAAWQQADAKLPTPEPHEAPIPPDGYFPATTTSNNPMFSFSGLPYILPHSRRPNKATSQAMNRSRSSGDTSRTDSAQGFASTPASTPRSTALLAPSAAADKGLTPPLESSREYSLSVSSGATRPEVTTDSSVPSFSRRSEDSLRRVVDARNSTPIPQPAPTPAQRREESEMEELTDSDDRVAGEPLEAPPTSPPPPVRRPEMEDDELEEATRLILSQAKTGASRDLSDQVGEQKRPAWALKREKELAESAIATTPIEEVDEDTLRSVLDERGFPRRAKPETSREERFARKLAKKSSDSANGSIHKSTSSDATYSTFGGLVAPKTRLDKVYEADSPRQNPFAGPSSKSKASSGSASGPSDKSKARSGSGSQSPLEDSSPSLDAEAAHTGIGELGGWRSPSLDEVKRSTKVGGGASASTSNRNSDALRAKKSSDALSNKTRSTDKSSKSGGSARSYVYDPSRFSSDTFGGRRFGG